MELFWRTTYYTVQAEQLGYDSIWITDHFNNRNVYVSTRHCIWGVGTFVYYLDQKKKG